MSQRTPNYQRILNPTDGSEAALRASRHALYLARHLRAHVHVLFVNEMPYYGGILVEQGLLDEQNVGKAALEQVAQLGQDEGVPVTTFTVAGRAGPVIVSAAEERQADLIVLGAHSKGALERALLGSTSQYVSQHASVPVLIVRER